MTDLGLMCFLMLESPVEFDRAAVRAALVETAPRSDVEVIARGPGDDGSGILVRIDDQPYVAVSEAGLLPEEICAMVHTGIFWPDRERDLAAHRAFIAISAGAPARGHGLVRAQAIALTRLAVAVARTTSALGMVWPASGTAVPAERLETVLEQIQSDRWPIDIWIGFQLGSGIHQGRQLIGARSRGGADYFGAEIEVFPIATTDKARPLRIVMQIAGHLMAHGVHLQDGQPIQLLDEQPMQIRLIPGQDGRPGWIRLLPAQVGTA